MSQRANREVSMTRSSENTPQLRRVILAPAQAVAAAIAAMLAGLVRMLRAAMLAGLVRMLWQ